MKKLILLIVSILAIATPVVSVSSASALFGGAKDQACKGITQSNTGCASDNGKSLSDTLNTAVNLFSFVVGLVAVIMILFAGLKFILARGDAAQVSSARNTVLFALVGLAIAALAKIIATYVLARVG